MEVSDRLQPERNWHNSYSCIIDIFGSIES